MPSWSSSAVVWYQDEVRGRVLIGVAGFAWWDGTKVFVAPFTSASTSPFKAYLNYTTWNNARSYDVAETTLSTILRFCRTGLWPAQGRLA